MPIDRREARREFKARTTPRGVFAVRCKTSGEAWVSTSGDLDSARTGGFFLLRQGMHHNKMMQAAWDAHGEAAFEFEILESFDGDMAPMLLKDARRDRQKHWERELGARMV